MLNGLSRTIIKVEQHESIYNCRPFEVNPWNGVNAQLVVQGKVMDSLSQPVPFANVLLLADSLVTGGAVSDSCGMIVIAAKLYGTYILSVSALGFVSNTKSRDWY